MKQVTLNSQIINGSIQLGRGNIISSKDIADKPGDYPIYSSSAQGTGEFGRYGDYMFDEELITWSIDGGGRFFFRPKHKFSVTNVSGFVKSDNEIWDRKFLYYSLDFQHSRLSFDYQTKAHPSVIRHLYSLADFPRIEQEKIGEILGTLDRAIEQTEALITKQQRIKTGLMQDLLTKGIDEHGNIRSEATHAFKDSPLGRIPVEWDVRLIGTVFDMQLGKMLSKKATEGKSPFPYLGNKNVQWDYVDLTELLEMDFTEQERKKYELLVDDILVCEGGEVGRTALWRGEEDCCYFQKAIHRLRPIENQYLPKLFPRFMRHAISTGAVMDFTSQTSIAHLTQEQLAALPIPVPEIEEQSRIVDAFDSVDECMRLENERLTKIGSLKRGLMHDLLTGNRCVTAFLAQAVTQ